MKKCAGYGPDPKVHVIPSTTSTNKFVVFLGSFSVYDPDVCVTTRVLMYVFQSVAASAKCDLPHSGFLDLANAHTKTAEDYKTAGGSKLHSFPKPDDATWIAVPRASQAYYDEVKSVCTKEGYKVIPLVLSPNVHKCYELAGCAESKAPYLPCHPSGHSGCPTTFAGIVGEIEILVANMLVDEGRFTTKPSVRSMQKRV